MKKRCKHLIAFFLIFISFAGTSFKADNELNIFISPAGNDNNSGSAASPLKTIEKAKSLLISLRKNSTYSKIRVNLMPGNYVVGKPLMFTYEDGGTSTCPIEYSAYRKGTVTVSGGVQLPANWVKDGTGKNVWKLKVSKQYSSVNQLFANGHSLIRSRSPIFYTKGPISKVKGDIEKLGLRGREKFVRLITLKNTDLTAFCSFAYQSKDLDDFNKDDFDNAELIYLNSWENSAHKVQKIDKVNGEIYLKTPLTYPTGFFSTTNRYYIENSRRYLTKPQTWFYDAKERVIWYMANVNENPNALKFVVPNVDQLINLNGDKRNKKPVANILFRGIRFEHTIAPRGINTETYRGKGKEAMNTPWFDYATGFNIGQAAVASGQAIKLYYANQVVFDSCDFTNLGAYGIRIDSCSNNNQVINCNFYNTGGGGVIIGFPDPDPVANHIPIESSPKGNVVKNCVMHDIARIYMSSVAIGIMNAVKTNITANEIYNTPYSGISTGWRWKKGSSYTKDNTIQNNRIHNVMQQFADGGGIYTLGTQTGTTISGNIIYDIGRNKDAVGSRNNGIFFDEGSSRLYVDGNKIYNITNEPIRYNESDPADIEWGTNEIEGSIYTGSDGAGVLPVEKFKSWLTDNRLETFIRKRTDNLNWVYIIPVPVLLITLLVYLKKRRRRKYKKNSQRFKG